MNIKDSGKRTNFNTGAVRDGQEGKGRMDLLPPRAVAAIFTCCDTGGYLSGYCTEALNELFSFLRGEQHCLASAGANLLSALETQGLIEEGLLPSKLNDLKNNPLSIKRNPLKIKQGKGWAVPSRAIIEVGKVLEAGAKKYAARNWEIGIPMSRFVDSGIRHLLKYVRGDRDEPHLAMATWNVLCGYETIQRIMEGILPPELNDLPWNPVAVKNSIYTTTDKNSPLDCRNKKK